MKVECRLDVQSTAERVWDVLTGVKAWPEWQGTSFIQPPVGPLQEGSTFPVELGGHRWILTVTEADRPRRLVWVGRQTGLRVLHAWELFETEGQTRVVSRESLSGWMLPFVYPLVRKKVAATDRKWLADLKVMTERA